MELELAFYCPGVNEVTLTNMNKTHRYHIETNHVHVSSGVLYFSGTVASPVNSLWPSDAIWWHKSGWSYAHVMAFCLFTAKPLS